MTTVNKIVPHLWYTKEAVEAANFYVSIFPDSHIDHSAPLPVDSPSGPAGSVDLVSFTLMGQQFMAISAGPLDPFNHSISFLVNCDTQEEIDRYWNGLLDGGAPEQCGWLRDRYGVAWQIVPTYMSEVFDSGDTEKARKVCDAMLKMVKLDISELQAAADATD